MRRLLLAAVLLTFFALPLFASTADLKVSVFALEPNVRPGGQGTYFCDITNLGPDVVRHVVVTITVDGAASSDSSCANGCTEDTFLSPGSMFQIPQSFVAPQSGVVTVHVSVQGDVSDPNPANNSATLSVPVSTEPDSAIVLTTDRGFNFAPMNPGDPFTLNVRIYNRVSTAHDLVATIDVPAEAAIVALPAGCTANAGRITCSLGDAGPDFAASLDLKLAAPSRPDGGSFSISGSVSERENDFYDVDNHRALTIFVYQLFFVTTTSDSGSGSLRQAFDDVNRSCATPVPCRIAFEIREASSTPWKTIHLRSPLPLMRAPFVAIDGQWQTTHVGDTNPDGPEIEITADGTWFSDGISLALACQSEVSGLAINNFFGNGISIVTGDTGCGTFPNAQLHDLYVGTDPTGTVAKPNALRGIVSQFTNLPPQQGALYASSASIHDCVLSGNARSGVFIASGATYVRKNRIGVKAQTDDPLPNGASGIYAAAGSKISDNVIAFNRDFGIALDGVTVDGENFIVDNRIWSNQNAALDYALDNHPTTSCNGMTAPVISGVRYDSAANQTVVDIDLSFKPRDSNSWAIVSIFGSDTSGTRGLGDAQRLLADVQAGSMYQAVPPHVTATIGGDHRGEWITATVTRASLIYFAKPAPEDIFDTAQFHCTTELSVPVQVP